MLAFSIGQGTFYFVHSVPQSHALKIMRDIIRKVLYITRASSVHSVSWNLQYVREVNEFTCLQIANQI